MAERPDHVLLRALWGLTDANGYCDGWTSASAVHLHVYGRAAFQRESGVPTVTAVGRGLTQLAS